MTSYIYHLCCPDTGEVRYIGKANEPHVRFRKHLDAAKNPQNYAQRWMAKLMREGKKPVLTIAREISECENWQEVERAAIAKGFDDGWKLTNTSAGGEGALLICPIASAKRKASVKEAWLNPQLREAQSRRQKRIQNAPENIEANRQRMLAIWKDPVYAKFNSDTVKAYYSTPEARKQQSDRTLAANKIPGVLERRAAGTKAAWADPERKEIWVAALTAAQNTPEAKARQADQMKARHKDPAYREKMKAVMADPEMHKRRGLAISAAKQKKKAERLAAQPVLTDSERAAIAAEKDELKKANYRNAWTPERRANNASRVDNMRQGLTPEVLAQRAETLRATHAKRKAERDAVAVKKATALREQQEKGVQEWIGENCLIGDSFLQLRHELFASYTAAQTEPMKQTQFYLYLEQLGFVMKKSSSRFYLGLKLAAATPSPYTESS